MLIRQPLHYVFFFLNVKNVHHDMIEKPKELTLQTPKC